MWPLFRRLQGAKLSINSPGPATGFNPHAHNLNLTPEQAYQQAIKQGFALLNVPINEGLLKKAMRSTQCGAFVSFEGWVRQHNNARPVQGLTYYGYELLAINQGTALIEQARQRFNIEQAIAVHRMGHLALGDMAIWIGVTAAHRVPAFEACHWLLDGIKAEVPVWKQEFYADSSEALWLSNNG